MAAIDIQGSSNVEIKVEGNNTLNGYGAKVRAPLQRSAALDSAPCQVTKTRPLT